MTDVGFSFRPLSSATRLDDFACSRQTELQDFFRGQALGLEQDYLARTYVAVPDSSGPVLGFYTICMGSVGKAELEGSNPGLFQSPYSRVPVALIAQVARADAQPKGVGKQIMVDALKRIRKIASEIGCAGVLLHAKNQGLVEYYKAYGFSPLKRSDFPRGMFLPLKALSGGNNSTDTATG